MIETPSYTLAATLNVQLINGVSEVYDSVLYLLQPLESGLGIDVVSYGHGRKFEMFRLANFTCTMKIYFKTGLYTECCPLQNGIQQSKI